MNVRVDDLNRPLCLRCGALAVYWDEGDPQLRTMRDWVETRCVAHGNCMWSKIDRPTPSCQLEFDGNPKKMLAHRVPFALRPKTGEIWMHSFLDLVVITTVDCYGRWYNYERVELMWPPEDARIKLGQIGQTDVLAGTAYYVDVLS